MSDIPIMNDEGLLSCPFCDSDSAFIRKDLVMVNIECCECGATSDICLSIDAAKSKWNTRKGHLWTVDDFKQMNAERNI